MDRIDGGSGAAERFVVLDGCFNFRDLGGYSTVDGRVLRRGAVYRSDGLHRLSQGGLASFAALGIATVIDLRTTGEVAGHPWRPPPGWAGRWVNLPLRDAVPDWSPGTAGPEGTDFAAAHYVETATNGAATVRAVVEALAEPGALPAVFHCAAGKDRTGVIAGLLLTLLGVPAGPVADDYALSEVATKRWEASIAAGGRDDTQTAWGYVPPAMLVADRRAMETFLARLAERHGSVRRFAADIGITDATLHRLDEALLVAAAGQASRSRPCSMA